uniref:Uncharacterized protein LOC114343067 n=1 Tax=Diabrotica virgifera virgifera TaxID=50390 RepID=A0A6P7GUI5_DIAVI
VTSHKKDMRRNERDCLPPTFLNITQLVAVVPKVVRVTSEVAIAVVWLVLPEMESITPDDELNVVLRTTRSDIIQMWLKNLKPRVLPVLLVVQSVEATEGLRVMRAGTIQ